MKPVSLLPTLLTLMNVGCGLLAISKAVDAITGDAAQFDRTLETACWLVFVAMIFDVLDGTVARITHSMSEFGAQMDSLADAVTFGVAPAFLAKVLLEHEGFAHPRIHFFAAASFSILALMRLARYNVEKAEAAAPDYVHETGALRSVEASDSGQQTRLYFHGIPSPAAAAVLIGTILVHLSLGGAIEVADGQATPVGRGLEVVPVAMREFLHGASVPFLLVLLPGLGLLMVSRMRFVHLGRLFMGGRVTFAMLVGFVFLVMFSSLAPVPTLFVGSYTYFLHGLLGELRGGRARRGEGKGGVAA